MPKVITWMPLALPKAGFEGVVKRHHSGRRLTHGAKGFHRRKAIGQRLFPGTVMRGMKMPGHMGQVRRTVQNLEIMQVREADNLLLIKGPVPGARERLRGDPQNRRSFPRRHPK